VNLPNALTLVRIFAVPLLVAVLFTKDHMLIAALIFLAASLTDLLDGYLARKTGQITTLGVLLDPVADKLLISAAFISLIPDIVPAWMVVIIVGREFAVSGLRSIASTQGFTISASELGKIKMVAQVAAITLLILGHQEFPILYPVGQFALYVVVLFAVVSAVDYFRTFWNQIDGRFKAQERQRTILNEKRARRDVPTP
jgi:CDP-diacylglycerol---glycerol-3-phosphate 3-phosphatidyltransferase